MSQKRLPDIDWAEFMKRAGPARHFSWWQADPFKPVLPAGREGLSDDVGELPKGEQKWRLNNPKKKR